MTNNSVILGSLRPNLYDYLKVFAIVFMVIDHVGFFLFPELTGLRAIGRWAFPVFLFLVGFNGSYKWRGSLWIAALIVEVPMQIFMYHYTGHLGAMNILIGIGLCRFFLSFLSTTRLHIKQINSFFVILGWCFFFLVLHYLGLKDILDYGGMVFIFGLLGYLYSTKNKERGLTFISEYPLVNVSLSVGFGLLAFGLHRWTQFEIFGRSFAAVDRLTVVLGWFALLLCFVVLKKGNPSLKTHYSLRDVFILWFSRYALWIYVGHIVFLVFLRLLLF